MTLKPRLSRMPEAAWLLLSSLLALAMVWWVYSPALHGPFALDDFANILDNAHIRVEAEQPFDIVGIFRDNAQGLFGRPLSMVSFAADGYLSGFTPYRFKIVNLIIHLGVASSLFFLTWLLLLGRARIQRQDSAEKFASWLSLLVVAVWALHPLNLTPAVYVVQRMTSLSSLMMVLGMIAYAWARLQMGRPEHSRSPLTYFSFWLSVPVFGILALEAKEIGTLLPLYICVIEAGIFRFAASSKGQKRALLAFHVAYVLLPCVLGLAWVAGHVESLMAQYGLRDFSLGQRLLTEPRALWFYLRLILAPYVSDMGLFHDDFPASTGLSQPMSTLPALLGILALLGVAGFALRKGYLLGFGVAWFLCGHLLESTFLPLELVFEHRNYLPSYGILLPLLAGLAGARPLVISRFLKYSIVIAVALFFGFGTHLRALGWSDGTVLAMTEADNHPRSMRANFEAGRTFHKAFVDGGFEWSYEKAFDYYSRANRLDPLHPASLTGLIALNYYAGKPIEESWLSRLQLVARSAKFYADRTNFIRPLDECQAAGTCRLPEGYIEQLFLSTLANPGLLPVHKAQFLAMYGEYKANRLHQYAQAIPLLEQAIQGYAGEFSFHSSLIQVRIGLKQFDRARQELDSLSISSDSYGHKKEIEGLRIQIAEGLTHAKPSDVTTVGEMRAKP
ncbi:MAG: hypothetical protein PHU46_16720 [Rhodocyclaceae bacterium]|nr:hypothetical protein [Rhodocyclaceae bacterium]